MELFTPPFVLPVMAAISSKERPVARNCSNRRVPAGSRSSALSAIRSASDCSIGVEASWPSDSHSGKTPLLTGPFLRHREMQLFFVADTAQASALRMGTPSRLATQSLSSTSCTTSSGSPSSRDARKNFRAVARTLGLISASSISCVLSILHRHRRKNRKKSRRNTDKSFVLTTTVMPDLITSVIPGLTGNLFYSFFNSTAGLVRAALRVCQRTDTKAMATESRTAAAKIHQ